MIDRQIRSLLICSKQGCEFSSRSEYGTSKKNEPVRQCQVCQKEFCRKHFTRTLRKCRECQRRNLSG